MKKQGGIKKWIATIAVLILCMLGVIDPFENGVSEENQLTSQTEIVQESVIEDTENAKIERAEAILQFRNEELLNSHYEKHGIEMGFSSAKEYEAAAAAVLSHPEVLHKIEAEDGDDVYYVESTNEFVVVSTDGYLRTYFLPNGGKKYFDRQ